MKPDTSRPICRRCVLPHSPPDITLDDEGICNVCRRFERNAASEPAPDLRETDFLPLLRKHRGKGQYDCLVMCSGGKDSTAALYYMKKRYRMNPLAFTFDHGFELPQALENVRNAVKALEVDFLYYRTERLKEVFRTLVEMRSSAPICHVCSIGYMKLTFDLAARFDVPLIIAGWTRGQSTSSGGRKKRKAEDEAPEYRAMSAATRDFVDALRRDRRFKDFPRSMEEAVARARKKHKATVLSPHWFLREHADEYMATIQRELNWVRPADSYPAKSTNCRLNYLSVANSMRDYGYTHYHIEMSKLIRQGLMTRDEALELLRVDFSDETLAEISRTLGVARGEEG